MKHLILAVTAALTLNIAQAVEVEGIKFDDTVKIGTSDLVINGTGVRRKFGKRYVMALYLPAKTGDVNVVLATKGAKRIAIRLTKDVSGDTFASALSSGMEDNNSAAEMAAVKDRLKQWSEMVIALGEVTADSTILIDWIPEKGTQLSINGQPKGKMVAGEDFYTALLKVWLGKYPMQDDIKSGLLGKAS